ncbi:MAG: type I glyceraldehyde-3-phosphate dehydrogenase [Planctomycetota bacterium]|jgi:glyceraldehyde 3-phosphate dehydrogenase
MKKLRVGFNGLGRIGKNTIRAILNNYSDSFDIVAANDLVDKEEIVRSFPKDSVHGKFPGQVEAGNGNEIIIDRHKIKLFSEKSPSNIAWKELNVDVVFECTGFFLTTEKALGHIEGGSKKVIISAPPKDETPIFVVGVNDNEITSDLKVISNASCTTNCLAPIAKALDDAFTVESCLMSTTHAGTATQRVIDGFGGAKNRGSLNNIIPATTGAAKAVGKVLKHLNGKMNGTALRVPVDDGSVVEAMFVIKGKLLPKDILEALQKATENINKSSYIGKILYVGDNYEVSADCIGSAYSSMVLSNNILSVSFDEYTHVKVTSFYDNEMGYSHRMLDLALLLFKNG